MNPRPQRCQRSGLEFMVKTSVLSEFEKFLRLNLRLEETTIPTNIQTARRYLEHAKNIVSYETIASYLETYLEKKPKTYNRQIVVLRHLIKDFLGYEELISPFKLAPVDEAGNFEELPSKAQVRKGANAQNDTRAKAIYLFVATSGLRRIEILNLLKDNVDFETRAVIPRHFTRKKRSGVTFYNEEAEEYLRKYLASRNDEDPKLFVLSERQWRKIWKRASEGAETKITPQILRAWFATELGELGVPDRYVDVFQGRAPRNVLAKHYTGKGLARLKRIYEKANLKIFA